MASAAFTYSRRVQADESGNPYVEHWVTQTLSGPWIAEYRFEWVAGEPLLVEVRVSVDPQYPGAIVSGVGQPAFQVAPPGGLTTELFREARLGAARAEIARSFEDELGNLEDAEEVRRILAVARLARERDHPRVGGWDDLRYVQLASAYVQKCRDGSRRPVKELEKELHMSSPVIRQRLTHARKRGWLTETIRRRPGGTLTDEGRRIANQSRKES